MATLYGNDYRQVWEWIRTRLKEDKGAVVLNNELYDDYAGWTNEQGEYQHSRNAVGRTLRQAGAGRYRRDGKRYTTGFRLAPTNNSA